MPRTRIQSTHSRPDRLLVAAQAVALLVGLALTAPTEVNRLRLAAKSNVGLVAWIFEIDLDTTIPLILLALLPLFWFIRLPRRSPSDSAGNRALPGAAASGSPIRAWAMAIACAVASLGASGWVASSLVGEKPAVRFGDLSPAYHDEFSYLFQAKTFLAGRASFPSHPAMPELFDQMHVVNEGRFASRYFPGAGVWMAPFLAIGHVYWGQWLAGGLAAFFTFWAGRELAGDGVGLLSGMLTALSPGMALFSNLLLAHHPTVAALSLFLFAFLRFMRTGKTGDAFWAGSGLSFAMLCRPMTAAGFGLPFGIWLLVRLADSVWSRKAARTPPDESARRPSPQFAASGLPANRRTTWGAAAALSAPLAIAFLGLLVYNRAVTGSPFVSPYELYTETYTPRHVYGFNNVVRGERHLGPKVLDKYDRWAENLTVRLAAKNAADRAETSALWTLGTVPLAMAGVVFLLAVMWRVDWRWRLVAASVATLHAVHVPYWFVGIMKWHYVFETGPLLLMIASVTTQSLVSSWREAGRLLMPAWWGLLVASAVTTNWLPFDPFWSYARVDWGIEEVAFARLRYRGFERVVDLGITQRPALLLIEGDPDDRSIDYVVNDPQLDAPVLRGRFRPGKTDLAQVRAAFPRRTLYLFQVKQGALRRLSD